MRRLGLNTVRARGLFAIGIPVAALLLATTLALALDREQAAADRRVDHTVDVITAVDAVRADLYDLGQAVRGYVANGDPEMLDRYRDARDAVGPEVDALSDLVSENPRQRSRVEALRVVVSDRIEAGEALATVPPPDPMAADVIEAVEEGRRVADDAFAQLDLMSAEEQDLLAERRDRSADLRVTVRLALVGSLALGVAGGAAAWLLGLRVVMRRIWVLEANARRIESGEPLEPLPATADELDGIATALEEAARLVQERERAAADRLEAEERLQAILEHTPSVVYVKDMEGRYRLVNRRFEEFTGRAAADVIGRTIADLFPAEQARVIEADDDAVRSSGEPHQFTEVMPNAAGEVRSFLSVKFPLRGPDGSVEGTCGISTDITERLAAEQAREEAREEAEEANRAKTDFLSRMSHELRTPLNSVLGFGQLLELEGLEDGQADSVQQILRAGRHLLDLIDEVLDISRIESGRLTVSLERVVVADLFAECVAMVEPQAAHRSISVSVDTPGGGVVMADRQRLKQVLLNLLSNAVKFNHDGGNVTVACTCEGDAVRITVTDTGPGISPAQQARLFTPFERLDAEARGVAGTGLGLALSKRLAELMGGSIGVESAPGRGSTFSVDLRAAEGESGDARPRGDEAPVAARPRSEGTGGVVLYVEDNPANLRVLERLLARKPDVTLLTAMQGSLGIELAREHRPDLVLLDLHLPDIEGDEVLARLKADSRTSAIPVVIVSADATPRKLRDLADLGAAEYVTKPLDLGQFLVMLDRYLARPSAAGGSAPRKPGSAVEASRAGHDI